MLAFGNIFLQETRHAPQDKVGSLLARGLDCYTKVRTPHLSLHSNLFRDENTLLQATHILRICRYCARKDTMCMLLMVLAVFWLSEAKPAMLRIFS